MFLVHFCHQELKESERELLSSLDLIDSFDVVCVFCTHDVGNGFFESSLVEWAGTAHVLKRWDVQMA